jgi:serine/threonine-protein kinase
VLEEGQVVGSYRVLKHLGGGGFAIVWKVEHIHLKSLHALKVLRDDLAARKDIRLRFLDEGRIHAQLRHPGIVRATDIIVEDGVAGLVMDFRAGLNLEQMIADAPEGLEPARVTQLALALLSALAFAHDNGVVHRDIKPANVIVTTGWDGRTQPVLLDFGIAQVRGALRSEGRGQTQVGDKMGTPGYMSPEQLRSAADVDPRSDLFGLGVVLLELLTGASPFGRDSDADTIVAVLAGDYEIPEGLRSAAPTLASAIERALSTDRDQRWESAAAMAEGLAGAVGEAPAAGLPAAHQQPVATSLPSAGPSPMSATGSRRAPATLRVRPAGALGLSLLKLAAALEGTEATVHVVPEFHEGKLASAVQSYVPDSFGDFLIHQDSTVFGGAKQGLIVTTDGICRREIFETPVCIPFGALIAASVTSSDEWVTFRGHCRNRGEEIEFRESMGTLSAALRLVEVIRLLRAAA